MVGSEQFAGYKGLADATARLAALCPPGSEVLAPAAGTRHHSFADVVWWAPAGLLRAARLCGPGDPRGPYWAAVSATRDFVRRHCHPRRGAAAAGGPCAEAAAPEKARGAL
jgi:hypothetical protein